MNTRIVSVHVRTVLARFHRCESRGRGMGRGPASGRTTALRMLEAELSSTRRIAAAHRELLRFIGDLDPMTSNAVGEMLIEEEERVEDLTQLLQGLPRR